MLELNKLSQLVTLPPHLKVCDIEEELSREELTLGYYPIVDNQVRLDTCLARRIPNLYVLKYGGLEELCVGGSVLTPAGRQFRFRTAPRAAMGSDLKRVMIGSHDLLGKFIDVTLKIFPRPQYEGWVLVVCELQHEAQELYRFLLTHFMTPLCCYLLDDEGARFLKPFIGRRLEDAHLIAFKLVGLRDHLLTMKKVLQQQLGERADSLVWVESAPDVKTIDEILLKTENYQNWFDNFGAFMGTVSKKNRQTGDRAFIDFLSNREI